MNHLSPERLATCAAVLDQACKDVGSRDKPIRETLAVRILQRANQGEQDFENLRSFAVAGFSGVKAAS
jgi:hypothetical protein